MLVWTHFQNRSRDKKEEEETFPEVLCCVVKHPYFQNICVSA